ncbi:MAG TPA: hypothetical protein VIP28_10995 [Nocardioides sp.]
MSDTSTTTAVQSADEKHKAKVAEWERAMTVLKKAEEMQSVTAVRIADSVADGVIVRNDLVDTYQVYRAQREESFRAWRASDEARRAAWAELVAAEEVSG